MAVIRKWRESKPATNKRYQRNLRFLTKWLRRVMLRYGMGYISITIIGDDYCSITSKEGDPCEGTYAVDEHWM